MSRSATGPRIRRSATPARLAALALGLALAPAAPAAALARAENGVIAFSGKRGASRAIYTHGSGVRVVPTGGRADRPAFSPQGRRLAFTRYGSLGSQIWITYLDGTGLRQLTRGPADSMAVWSPSGAELVFARGPRGRRDLYRIGADGTTLRRLTLGRRDDHSPSWSVKDRIAFVRRNAGGGDIYWIPRTGGTPRRLTRSGADDASPAWSPTGRTLAFARGRAGRRDLYLVSADGAHKRRLTAVPGDEGDPAWSPDGSRIVFSYRKGSSRRLYLVKVKGKPIRRLPSRRSPRARRLTSSRSSSRYPSWQPTGFDPVVAAAGDIACDPGSAYFEDGLGIPGFCRQLLTSNLLLRADLSRVLVLGDAQYDDGKLWKFQRSFGPSWGRLRELMRPVPGNHEYDDPGAAGYFDYFNGVGQQTGPAGERGSGYYSYDLGAWHVVALNSECAKIGGCDADSPQLRWLRADLAAHPALCTLAYWHRPLFTSGRYRGNGEMRAAWNVLYSAGADVVLDGHEHFYERFAPQTPTGATDPARGIRQFTVGVGGRGRHPFVDVKPNSEVRENRVLGELQLTLGEDGYDWRLVKAPSGRSADSGAGFCH